MENKAEDKIEDANEQKISGDDTSQTNCDNVCNNHDDNSEKKEKEKKVRKVKIDENELSDLREKVEQFSEMKDGMVRKIADFENAKKRLIKEKEDFAKFANEKIIGAFLPVLDNFDRAIQHCEKNEATSALLSGVELIKKQIDAILKDNGLEKLESVNSAFDPHLHEAIGMVKTSEHEAGIVVEEVQCGYKLKDRLLRPAWVRVSEEDVLEEIENTAEIKDEKTEQTEA